LISTLYFLGDTKAAVARSREVIPILERVFGPRNRVTLNAKSFLARALLVEGGTQEALAILEEIAPHMSDDTYVNLALANLEVWFGKDESYERTRARMLDYCIKNRDSLISRPDILERALLICSLTPLKDETQKRELLNTLGRCQEIRKAGNAPKITEPNEAWRQFVAGVVYLRAGETASAINAFDCVQRPDPETGKPSPDAALAALLKEIARHQDAEKSDDVSAALKAAGEKLGSPASEQEPMLGRRSVDASPLTSWNFLREATSQLNARSVRETGIPSTGSALPSHSGSGG
jgi:tetratricopeptide (TPR) repeat protein